MNVAAYLLNQQPLLYRQFSQALARGKLSHAYLLAGEAGTPLLELAKYLAQSLVCEHPAPLADMTCWSCLRVMDGNYVDMHVYDGALASIKKEDIQTLTADFERTPVEPAGKLIYILHLVENMTVEAVNSLLKFLEEPHQEVYAFLTTENENKVLPTIISRTQRLRVMPADRELLVANAMSAGLSERDAGLLSFFHHDEEAMRQLAGEDHYKTIVSALDEALEVLAVSWEKSYFILLDRLGDRISQKEHLRLLVDIWALILADLVAFQNGREPELPSYAKILRPLSERFAPLESALMEVLLLRGHIEMNVGGASLLDHMFHITLREYRHDDH